MASQVSADNPMVITVRSSNHMSTLWYTRLTPEVVLKKLLKTAATIGSDQGSMSLPEHQMSFFSLAMLLGEACSVRKPRRVA